MKKILLFIVLSLAIGVISAQTQRQRTPAKKSQTTVRKSAPNTANRQAQAVQVKKSKTNFCPDNRHPHAIDLGLPSETLWACCNVGATIPEEYGGSYAVGELKEKKKYSPDTYKFCENGSGDSYSRTWNIIGSEHDVAHVKWGKEWQMPTIAQFQELINNCIFEYTKIDGIGGAKMIGPNGNVIFLPGAGFSGGIGKGNGYYFPGNAGNVMVIKGYWPQILFSESGIKFDSSSGYRYHGHSVRPVKDER